LLCHQVLWLFCTLVMLTMYKKHNTWYVTFYHVTQRQWVTNETDRPVAADRDRLSSMDRVVGGGWDVSELDDDTGSNRPLFVTSTYTHILSSSFLHEKILVLQLIRHRQISSNKFVNLSVCTRNLNELEQCSILCESRRWNAALELVWLCLVIVKSSSPLSAIFLILLTCIRVHFIKDIIVYCRHNCVWRLLT